MAMRLQRVEGKPAAVKSTVEWLLRAVTDYTTINLTYSDFAGTTLASICQLFTSVSAVVFAGSGLDDGTSGGTYTGTVDGYFTITIDSEGTPDTFKWSKTTESGTGTETTGVSIVGGVMTIAEGVTITFAATTGHTDTESWTITVMAA